MHGQKLLGTIAVALGILALGCGGNQPGADGPLATDGRVVEGPVEDHTKPGRFCELHNIPYAEEVIPSHYFGKPETPKWTEAQRKWMKEEFAARNEGYPYSHLNDGIGGCMVREAKFAKVNYCPECRKADLEWNSKHRRPADVRNPD